MRLGPRARLFNGHRTEDVRLQDDWRRGILINSLAVPAVFASDAMPLGQQGALVKKYCVVCHNDTRLIGGMSLEHLNPAHPDPSIAGMMVSKLQ